MLASERFTMVRSGGRIRHPEEAPFLPFVSGSAGATLRTFHVPVGPPGVEKKAVSEKVHGFVPDTFQAVSMVEYGRGHG